MPRHNEKKPISIHIGRTVLVALSLDDDVMQKELDVEVIRSGKLYAVIGDLEHIQTVLDDIRERSKKDSFEQPSSWRRACAHAWERTKAEVEAQGYIVYLTAGCYSRVVIKA